MKSLRDTIRAQNTVPAHEKVLYERVQQLEIEIVSLKRRVMELEQYEQKAKELNQT